MNILLWILQVLLAVVFVLHGWLYVLPPADARAAMEQSGLPMAFLVFIGLAEWAGAAGLVLPGLTRVAPWLTPLAAVGLMVVAASATVYHLIRGEAPFIVVPLVLMALLAVVAYGRWKVRPLRARAVATR